MKKSLFLFVFISALGIVACKKKTTAVTPSTPSGPSASSPQPYSEIKTKYTYNDNGSVIYVDSAVRAIFYDVPQTSSFTSNAIYAGNITLNDSVINYAGADYGCGVPLTSCPKVNMRGPITWSVSGSGTVTPFTYSYTPVYPIFTGSSLLPDTCVKANGIIINLSSIVNATDLFVSVSQSTLSIDKQIQSPFSSVIFSTSELASFNTNQNLTIHFYIRNSWNSTQGGVLHGFKTILEYYKGSYIK